MMRKHIGVRYVYEKAVDSRQSIAVSEESEISNLPDELLENLKQKEKKNA